MAFPLRPDLDKLEALLHYFHVTLKPAVAGWGPEKHSLVMANVACVAAEAFITRKR